MTNDSISIAIIGAGNVGYHLGRRLHERGFAIRQVFSRHLARAENLAHIVSAEAVNQLENVRDDADLYILAVHDDAIAEVAAKLPVTNKLLVHTSGATPSTVLTPHAERFGIFYPLQTFSINRPVDFEQIPICVHANADEDVQLLEQIARQISSNVYRIDDAQRGILHVAAVFVNNFVNYMFQVGYDILERENLSFDLLRPLILETAQKVQDDPPAAMQTGPAMRGDQATIDKHLQYLKQFPAYRQLYEMLTQHIQQLTINN